MRDEMTRLLRLVERVTNSDSL